MLRTYNLEQIYQGRLETGADLLAKLTETAVENDIEAGQVSALGAVKTAVISYYDQQEQVYREKSLDQRLEIVNLTGNISLKEGQPILHAHLALADQDGRVYGGHLESGTTVFACEFTIQAYQGQAWERGFDQPTGLPLWQTED